MAEARNTENFYTRLPVNEISLPELFSEEHLFFRVPVNWHAVITDVKNSTAAIANGLHQTINLVATGSIVAVLNIAYKNNLNVPFFFGGDGATFLVPPLIFEECMRALQHHKENVLTNFDIDLRVGEVPVADIYKEGHFIGISKLKTTGQFVIPVLLGDGLMFAEQKIKGPDYMLSKIQSAEALDLSGMQCRWDRIKPPETYSEVVSLLVVAQKVEEQATIFKNVMEQIESIYGAPNTRQPISVEKLKLKVTLDKIKTEMKAKIGSFRPFYLFSTLFKTWLGVFYFKTKQGKAYLHDLVNMSDTLIIDGRINTVISGTAEQRIRLENSLNGMEMRGEILYGLHVSKESVMSCYVHSMNERHIHFVDGAEGGYTKAAGVLKQKI